MLGRSHGRGPLFALRQDTSSRELSTYSTLLVKARATEALNEFAFQVPLMNEKMLSQSRTGPYHEEKRNTNAQEC
jgi:hypothetical protein